MHVLMQRQTFFQLYVSSCIVLTQNKDHDTFLQLMWKESMSFNSEDTIEILEVRMTH